MKNFNHVFVKNRIISKCIFIKQTTGCFFDKESDLTTTLNKITLKYYIASLQLSTVNLIIFLNLPGGEFKVQKEYNRVQKDQHLRESLKKFKTMQDTFSIISDKTYLFRN